MLSWPLPHTLHVLQGIVRLVCGHGLRIRRMVQWEDVLQLGPQEGQCALWWVHYDRNATRESIVSPGLSFLLDHNCQESREYQT